MNACCERVVDGPSMVRGLNRMRNCEGKVVFEHGGKHYCAVHGKAVGYVAPVKAKQSYVIFYTSGSGRKSYQYSYDKASMKGAKMAFARNHPGDRLDGIAEYHGDAAMRSDPACLAFKEYWD